MSTQSIIEVNSALLCDYNNHNKNQAWIVRNIPTPKPGNRYEQLRKDAPFYCSSSLGVMIDYYRTKSDFRELIDEMVSHFIEGNLPNANLSELIDWIIYQTTDCIKQDNSERTDLQNVGWWMGRSVYVVSIASMNYKAQYEKIFLESWCKYFTNENLDGDSFSSNNINNDYLSLLEEYLFQLNVPFKKEILSGGEVFYSFTDFSSGFVNIKVVLNNNTPVGLSIRGLHKEMNELAYLVAQTNSLLNIPILQYMVMDGDKITPQIIAVIKN